MHYTYETPEGQQALDGALRRQAEAIDLIENRGWQQRELARQWGISSSRAFQIYRQGLKHRRQGLI